jgi:hypothetical protein
MSNKGASYKKTSLNDKDYLKKFHTAKDYFKVLVKLFFQKS